MNFLVKFKVIIFISIFAVSIGWSQESMRIPNLQQVTEQVFRGGRPVNHDLESMQRNYGIHAIIDLENNEQAVNQEKQVAGRIGVKFLSSPMSWQVRPTDQQIDQILQALQDEKNFPIFLHCAHGEDRTGLLMGLYRVEVQGWTPEKAYLEMLKLGFHPKFKALDDYFRDRTGFH